MESQQIAQAEADGRYKLIEAPIGQGAYGAVFKGTYLATGQDIAMKRTKIENVNDGIPSTTLREISILYELEHPNIVKLIDVIMAEQYIWFV